MQTNKMKPFIIGSVFLLLSPALCAENQTPSYDPATTILTLPMVNVTSGSNSATSYVQTQVRLNSIDVLAAVPVEQTFSSEIAMGAIAYSAYYVTEAGGDGNKPEHADYTRCKACHGWDALATAGGYVRRSDGGGSRSAAVNIRLDRTDYTADQILNGSWTPGVDTPTGSHPDYSSILTTQQASALVAYLNSPGAKFSAIADVYNAPNPAQYTIAYGDATRGQSFYSANCQSCHGTPTDDGANQAAGGPSGSLSAYFKKDGKPSEFAHKSMWGDAGKIMTRASIGNPTTQNIADLMKYFQTLE